MALNRRKFIRNSSLLLAGTAWMRSNTLTGKNPRELTGVQLYSVRADMMKDPRGTLEKLASFGYKRPASSKKYWMTWG
jgi:hypothetical protein